VEVSGAGRENDAMSFDTVAFGGEGHIGEVFIVSQLTKRLRIFLLKFIPTETVVFVARCDQMFGGQLGVHCEARGGALRQTLSRGAIGGHYTPSGGRTQFI